MFFAEREIAMAEYQVAAVWWPDGWEPSSPLDVPRCIGWAGDQTAAPKLAYEQALATVQGLNRQNMEQPGATWYVVASAGEGGLQAISHKDGGTGDCSHCPAHAFPCASAER
jgi:hypothetical protein